MKKQLFEYTVLHHKSIGDAKDKQIETSIIVPTAQLLATDERVALLQVAKQIPDNLQESLQDLEILIRPF